MNMEKIVSQLDDAGYFVGPAVADACQREPGVFIIPGGRIELAPPQVEPGKRYRPEAGSWVAEDIPQLEAPLPETVPDRRAEIMDALAAIDTASIRPAREVAAALVAGKPTPEFPAAKLLQLEADAAALRQELADLSP